MSKALDALMTMLGDLFQWIVLQVGVAFHYLFDSGWVAAIGIFLVVMVILALKGVEYLARGFLADELSLKRERIYMGGGHSAASAVVFVLGGLHLGSNLLGSTLSGLFGMGDAWRYGLEGYLMGVVGLDVLAPLPFVIAFPLALMLYGYIYGLVLYFSVVRQHSKGGSFRVAFDAFISVTFVGFRVLIRWLKSFGSKKKKTGENTDGEEQENGDGGSQGGPQALSVEECAARSKTTLKHGFLVWRSSNGTTVSLLERFAESLTPYVGPTMAIMSIAIVSVFLDTLNRDDPPHIKLPIGVDEFISDVGASDESVARTKSGLPQPLKLRKGAQLLSGGNPADLGLAVQACHLRCGVQVASVDPQRDPSEDPMVCRADCPKSIAELAGRAGGDGAQPAGASAGVVALAKIKRTIKGDGAVTDRCVVDPGEFYSLAERVIDRGDRESGARLIVNGALCELILSGVTAYWDQVEFQMLDEATSAIQNLPEGVQKWVTALIPKDGKVPAPIALAIFPRIPEKSAVSGAVAPAPVPENPDGTAEPRPATPAGDGGARPDRKDGGTSTNTGGPTQSPAAPNEGDATAGEQPLERPSDEDDPSPSESPLPSVTDVPTTTDGQPGSFLGLLTTFVESYVEREKRMRMLRDHVRSLSSEDNARFDGYLVASMLHAVPGYEAQRKKMLKGALASLPEVKPDAKEHWSQKAQLLLATASHANLMVSLHRFDESVSMLEDFRDDFSERSKIGKKPLGAADCVPAATPIEGGIEALPKADREARQQLVQRCAFLSLLDLNVAATYSKLHRQKDATQVLDGLDLMLPDRKMGTLDFDSLKSVVAAAKNDLDADESELRNAYHQYRRAYFGPIHAGMSAAFVLFIFGLWATSRSQKVLRSGRKKRLKPAPSRAEQAETDIVPWQNVLKEINDNSSRMTLLYDATAPGGVASDSDDLGAGVPNPLAAGAELKQATAEALAEETVNPTILPAGKAGEGADTPVHDLSGGGSGGAGGEPPKPKIVDPWAEGLVYRVSADPMLVAETIPGTAPEEGRIADEDIKEIISGGWPGREFLNAFFQKNQTYDGQRSLFLHQQRVSEILDGFEHDLQTKQKDFHSVLLSTNARSGRTTSALFESGRTLLQRGSTVLFISRDARESQKLGNDFNELKSKAVWGWNIQAVQGGDGLIMARQHQQPVQLLFADVETVMRDVLPLVNRKHLLTFLRSLGLIVVEDIDRLTQPRAAHTAFVLRRLGELLEQEQVFPSTLVTSQPVMAKEKEFVTELLGPFGRGLRLITDGYDHAPSRPRSIYLFGPSERGYARGRDEARQRTQLGYYELGGARQDDQIVVPHRLAALVQAHGVPAEQKLDDNPQTSWPTAHVGFGDEVSAFDDRSISVYRSAGVHRTIEIPNPSDAMAVVVPFTHDQLPRALSDVKHCGIALKDVPSDDGASSEEDRSGAKKPTSAPAVEGRRELKILGLIGPEPVDRWLVREFLYGPQASGEKVASMLSRWAQQSPTDTDAQAADGDQASDTTPLIEQWLEVAAARFKPERVLPMGNRIMNKLHLEQAMLEVSSPGHLETHLRGVFDERVYKEFITYLEKRGQLDRGEYAEIDDHDGSIQYRTKIFSSNVFSDNLGFRPDSYVDEVFSIKDRVTDQLLGQIEAVRAHLLFHEGRIFSVDGERYTVDSMRRQRALDRRVLYCDHEPIPRRSARIRHVAIKPLDRDPSIPFCFPGGQEFLSLFTRVNYSESLLGVRVFHDTKGKLLSQRTFDEAIDVSFETDAFVMGFDARILGELFDEADAGNAPTLSKQKIPIEAMMAQGEDHRYRKTLHGLVLLLRQTLPLVLDVSVDDIEIAFGFGPADANAPAGENSALIMRMDSAGHEGAPEEHEMAWIAFVDRMEGGLGYARLMYDRMRKGRLLREVFVHAYDLLNWSAHLNDIFTEASTDGAGVKEKRKALLNVFDKELGLNPEHESGSYAFSTARLYERYGPISASGRPDPNHTISPWWVRSALERLLGVTQPEEYLDTTEDLGTWVQSDAAPARRGLSDLLGLRPIEEQLTPKGLPGFTTDSGSPWAVAILCALLARNIKKKGASPAAIRANMERAIMVIFALARRVDRSLPAPVVGTGFLQRFRPEDGDVIRFESKSAPDPTKVIPLLNAEQDRERLALWEVYGELTTDMGLTTEAMVLTERGQWVAMAMDRLAQGFGPVIQRLETAALHGEFKVEGLADWLDGFAYNDLPVPVLNLLADGFAQGRSAQRYGAVWRDTMTLRGDRLEQPANVAAQLFAARDDDRLSQAQAQHLLRASAIADLDRRFREAVNYLRVNAQTPVTFIALGETETAEGKERNPDAYRVALYEAVDAVKPFAKDLSEAARALCAELSGDGFVAAHEGTEDAAPAQESNIEYLKRMRQAQTGGRGAGSTQTPAEPLSENAEFFSQVVRFLKVQLGGHSPFRTASQDGKAFLAVHSSWSKKHATDDSAGLSFGFDCFGRWIAETGWGPTHRDMGLTNDVGETPAYDAVPNEWDEWPRSEVSAPSREVQARVKAYHKRAKATQADPMDSEELVPSLDDQETAVAEDNVDPEVSEGGGGEQATVGSTSMAGDVPVRPELTLPEHLDLTPVGEAPAEVGPGIAVEEISGDEFDVSAFEAEDAVAESGTTESTPDAIERTEENLDEES